MAHGDGFGDEVTLAVIGWMLSHVPTLVVASITACLVCGGCCCYSCFQRLCQWRAPVVLRPQPPEQVHDWDIHVL